MYNYLDFNMNGIKRKIGRSFRSLKVLPRAAASQEAAFDEIFQGKPQVHSWRMFRKEIRHKNIKLLSQLEKFPSAVLVAGCQRSGTTMLSRIITGSKGMTNFWFGSDDELAAALILCGYVKHKPVGRYCFQTTYVNEYHEYLTPHSDYQLIWLFRNPYAVVYSMLYNWDRYALDKLYEACGMQLLSELCDNTASSNPHKVPAIVKACLSYKGKVSQVFSLMHHIDRKNILLLDYDTLLSNKDDNLPQVYGFIGLDYQKPYADKIKPPSSRKVIRLKAKESKWVEEICLPIYQEAKKHKDL